MDDADDGYTFHVGGLSGVLTGIAANGVVFAFRNPPGAPVLEVLEVDFAYRSIAGFTAAQEIGVAAHWVKSFGAVSYLGGTDLSHPTTSPAYLNVDKPLISSYDWAVTGMSQLVSSNIRIAATGALTHSGSPVILSQPFAWDSYAELAAGATVGKGFAESKYRGAPRGQRIAEDAGFVVRLPIAMGAGGTGRLFGRVVWREFGGVVSVDVS